LAAPNARFLAAGVDPVASVGRPDPVEFYSARPSSTRRPYQLEFETQLPRIRRWMGPAVTGIVTGPDDKSAGRMSGSEKDAAGDAPETDPAGSCTGKVASTSNGICGTRLLRPLATLPLTCAQYFRAR
jgi:hypothetical protein